MARRNTVEIAIQARDEASRQIERAVRTVSSEFNSLNSVLRRVGVDSNEISRINDQIRRVNPGILEHEIDRVRDTLRRMGADSEYIDRITTQMRNATTAAQQTERKLGDLDKALIGVGNSATHALSQGLAVAATGAAVGLGYAVKSAADFEQSMADIKAVSGLTADEMVKVKELTMQAGADTKYSASEAALGMEELIKAGVELDEIMDDGGLKGALDLAVAGTLDLADSAEIASTALNSFKKDNLSVTDAANLLAGAANASATKVEEMKYGLSASAAVLAGAGATFEDTATALAVLAQNGLKGSDAGTSLKTMFMNLQPSTDAAYNAFDRLGLLTFDTTKAMELLASKGIKPVGTSADSVEKALRQYVASITGTKEGTAKAEKAFREFTNANGILQSAFFDSTGSIKSMADISELLKTKMAGMTDAQRLQTMEIMFGSDAIRAANILFKEGAAGIEKMNESMSNVTAAEVAETKMNTLWGAVEKMKGAVQNAAIALGTELIPDLTNAAKSVDSFVTNANKTGQLKGIAESVGNAFKTAFEILKVGVTIGKAMYDNWNLIAPVVAGVGASLATLKVIGTVTVLWNAYKASAFAATLAQSGLNAALMANPIGLVAAAIGLLVTAGVLLYKNWDTVKAKTIQFYKVMDEKLGAFKYLVAPFTLLIDAGIALYKNWDTIKAKAKELKDKVTGVFANLPAEAMEWGKHLIDGLVKGLGQHIGEAADKAREVAKSVSDAVKGFFGIHSPSRLMAEYGGYIAQGLAKGMDDNADIVAKIGDKLATAAHSKLQHVKDRVQNEIEELKEKIKSNVDQMAQSINDGLNKVKDLGSTLSDIAGAKFEIFKNKLGETGDKTVLLTAQLNTLSQQIAIQYDVVQVAKKAYDDMKKLKGENAVETKKLELAYLQEKNSLEALNSEVRKTNTAIKEQQDAQDNMAKSVKEVADQYRNDMAAAAEEYWQKISDVNSKLAEDEKKLTEEYKNQVDQRASALKNFVGLFDEIQAKEVTGGSLLKNLRDQVTAFKGWAGDIKTLAARGVDQGLIKELQEMGPKAGPEIAALNTLTQEQLTEYVALWKEKAQAANDEAINELVYLKDETNQKITDLRVAAMAEVEKYKNEWAAKNAELSANALKAVTEIQNAYTELTGKSTTFGTDFMQGIITGMESKYQELAAAVDKVKGMMGASGAVDVMPTSSTVKKQTSSDSMNAVIVQAKEQYASAKTAEERAAAHALAEWARSQGGTIGSDVALKDIPGLAGGGTVRDSGLTWVGEEGPELLDLPRGSRVTPLDKMPSQSVVEHHYHFAAGSVVIPAKDLKEMQEIQDFFKRFPQVARAMGN